MQARKARCPVLRLKGGQDDLLEELGLAAMIDEAESADLALAEAG